jgi:hypothetical protein
MRTGPDLCNDYTANTPWPVRYLRPSHLPGCGKRGIHNPVGSVAGFFRGKKFPLRFEPPFWILLIALVILFGPILAGVRSIFWGLPLLQFFPWHETAKQALLGGHLPLWNPDLGMGAPLLANAQSALLYPPNALLLILPVEYGQGLLMVAHLLLAGYGMVRLSRELGIGPTGQTAAGLAFMLSGYLAARAWFLSINASVAWLPWIILAGERAVRRERGIFSAPLALSLCLQWLAGHWQTAWYTGLILAGWMAVRSLSMRPAGRSLLRAAVRLLTAGLAAFGLGAAQFLPTVGYWMHSQRAAGVDPEAALSYSFWPWRLITLIAPDFFGNPVHGDYWGYANYWEDAVYIGLLPLVLAAWAAIRGLRRKGMDGFPYAYLLVLLPLTLIPALGKNTPIFPFLFRYVPTFDFFQAPTRIMIGFVFALCLLGAAGVEQWLCSEERSGRRAALFLTVAAAAAIGGWAAGFLEIVNPSFTAAVTSAGGLGILVGGLWFLKYLSQSRASWRRFVPAAAVAIIAVDLIAADAGLVPAADPDLYRAAEPSAAGIAGRLDGRRIYMPEDIRYRLMYDYAFRFDTFAGLADWTTIRRWQLPDVGVIDGIPSANNFDAFVFERYAVLVEELDSLPEEQRDRWLDMMDVGVVWEWPQDADEPVLRYLPQGAVRAWGVCRAEWVIGPADAWNALIDPQFDPAQSVILEAGRGSEGADCPSPPRVEILPGSDPNGVRIAVDFPAGGYLVLADMNDDGWEAFLDDGSVPVLQADYALRAVRVPAGEHIVEFRYTPPAFWLGAVLSCIAAGLLAAGGIAGWLRKRGRRHPSAVQTEGPEPA